MRGRVAYLSIVIAMSLFLTGLLRAQVVGLAEPRSSAVATSRVGSAGAFQQSGQNATSAAGADMALGPNASLGGRRLMSPDSAWNTPVDHLPVDALSDKIITAIGGDSQLHPDFGSIYNGIPWGIPYIVVSGDTKRYPVLFDYAGESDDALYPIPPDPPIEGVAPGKMPEGDGDHHLLVVDKDNARLYELYDVRFKDRRWHAGSGAIWDLFGDTRRPRGWTSADAAGLAILPGLVRYDEMILQKRIDHALRFTVPKSRRAYVAPATHAASRDTSTSLPPMGLRVRLKASVDEREFPATLHPLLVALKRYGMILADNGGPFFLSGAPDPRWPDADINLLKKIKGRDFEVVQLGGVTEP